MGGANNWRQNHTGQDWMRDVEKRILHEERRPNIRTASDLLGPGIAPYSIWVNDWNTDETGFNGFFHSEPGAFNVPISDRYWMGTSQATGDGFGIQRVSEYRGYTTDITWPRPTYVRKFFTGVGLQRQFSAWKVEDSAPVGMVSQFAGANVWPTTASDGSAWVAFTGWSITSQETRIVGESLLYVDVEVKRTGAPIAITASGDVTNTGVAVLSTNYTILANQAGMHSGQQGRSATFYIPPDRITRLTSAGGTVDIATNETVEFSGVIPGRLTILPAVVAPNGWLPCDGTLRDVVDYPDLYSAIGTLYNTGGEPGTQFRLPLLVGRVIKA